jgi:hypothetical protein
MGRHNQHFPKWLLEERFEITHTPIFQARPFGVVLFSGTSARYVGYGDSIAEAAKDARKKREGSK